MSTRYRDILDRLRLAFPQPVSDRVHDSYFVHSIMRAMDQVDSLKTETPAPRRRAAQRLRRRGEVAASRRAGRARTGDGRARRLPARHDDLRPSADAAECDAAAVDCERDRRASGVALQSEPRLGRVQPSASLSPRSRRRRSRPISSATIRPRPAACSPSAAPGRLSTASSSASKRRGPARCSTASGRRGAVRFRRQSLLPIQHRRLARPRGPQHRRRPERNGQRAST